MSLDEAYDPEAFRAAGHRMIDRIADYLTRAGARDMPVLAQLDKEQLLRSLSSDFSAPQGELTDLLTEVVQSSNHVHHPGFIGHQVSAPIPTSILAEATSALLSNGMAIYEMGQMQTVMERHVVRFLANELGLPESADGVLTHGGSLGNMTALLAARQSLAGHDIWTEGQKEPLALLVSDQAHYCVARAVQCMGWGAGGAIAVPSDDLFRMRRPALEASLEQAQKAGRKTIAVVASSCSTALGSFDPLDEIADFCRDHGLWLHVDGAHGASLALSTRHRSVLSGIERADSVVWDLHKMMGLPALNTAVLFRDSSRSYAAFAQDAAYLFEGEQAREEWFNIGLRTMECTKRGLSVTAYVMLATLGRGAFEANVDRLVGRARELAELLDEADDFELAMWPQANILCFRYSPPGDSAGGNPASETLDELQRRIRSSVLEQGRFYIVQARVRGSTWLRTTVTNPATTGEDIRRLVEELRRCAKLAPA